MKKLSHFVMALLLVPWTACDHQNEKIANPSSLPPMAEMIIPHVPDTTLPSGRINIYLHHSRADDGFFAERTIFPAGYLGMPHVHNAPLYVTVLTGSAHIILGSKLDTTIAHKPLGPGSFLVIPADQPHFDWFTERCSMQIEGIGPVNTFYVPQDSAFSN